MSCELSLCGCVCYVCIYECILEWIDCRQCGAFLFYYKIFYVHFCYKSTESTLTNTYLYSLCAFTAVYHYVYTVYSFHYSLDSKCTYIEFVLRYLRHYILVSLADALLGSMRRVWWSKKLVLLLFSFYNSSRVVTACWLTRVTHWLTYHLLEHIFSYTAGKTQAIVA